VCAVAHISGRLLDGGKARKSGAVYIFWVICGKHGAIPNKKGDHPAALLFSS